RTTLFSHFMSFLSPTSCSPRTDVVVHIYLHGRGLLSDVAGITSAVESTALHCIQNDRNYTFRHPYVTLRSSEFLLFTHMWKLATTLEQTVFIEGVHVG
ncbi:hypothetical protein BDZ97DRAFT_1779604, partial [Flammula alnicola]